MPRNLHKVEMWILRCLSPPIPICTKALLHTGKTFIANKIFLFCHTVVCDADKKLPRIYQCHDLTTTLFGNSLAFSASVPSASK